MTIQQLQYLLEVYHAGSISQAARNLYVAQSSISNSISYLEKELGFRIFNRSRAGVTPTAQGQVVLEQASRINESYRRMSDTQHSVSRNIRISSTPYLPIRDAFIKLSLENQMRDDVTLSYLSYPLSVAIEKLAFFELELAVILSLSGRPDVLEDQLRSKGLCWNEVQRIPAVLRIGPNHPLYSEPEVRLQDFQKYTLVDSTNGVVFHDEYLRAVLSLDPRRVMFVEGQEARSQLVARGTSYSVGCKLPAHIDRQCGFRSIPLGNLEYRLIAVSNPIHAAMPEIQRFLALLNEELTQV